MGTFIGKLGEFHEMINNNKKDLRQEIYCLLQIEQ